MAVGAEGPQIYKLLSPEEVEALKEGGGAEGGKKKKRKKAPEPAIKAASASTIFGSVAHCMPTTALATVFRFRVLVGKNMKVAKPYVATRSLIKLIADRPVQVHPLGT